MDIEETVVEYLETLEPKERVEKIDDLLHRLNFERRFALLTDEEQGHMMNQSLSPAAHKKLREAKMGTEREGLITMYARSIYFRQCAWIDYLNGVTDKKLFCSEDQKKVA